MFNIKQNFYSTGLFVLCALAGCSSDNPSSAGSTTIPNATAEKIEFTTAATSTITVDGGELKSFEAENGASATCSANGITYSSEIQINSNNLVVTHLKLENAGKLCSGIFTRFSASCGSIPSWWEGCDEDGNLELFCGDHRMESLTICTATNPSSCTTKEGDSTITFNAVVSDFSNTATDICNKIFDGAESYYGRYETPSSSSTSGESSSSVEAESSSSKKTTPQLIDEYGNPITEIDTAKYTLSNYTAQFTDDPSELSFDSHVLAYNGNPQNMSGLKIKEISLDEVAQNFPLTAAVAGEIPLSENCKLFVIGTDDGGQPTGHVLSKITEGSIEITEVLPGGMCMQTAMFFTVAFLVKDCDGLLDENAEISYKRFTSKTWACETLGSPTKKASAYGEWYRADLRE
jgi:hypothetical protein